MTLFHPGTVTHNARNHRKIGRELAGVINTARRCLDLTSPQLVSVASVITLDLLDPFRAYMVSEQVLDFLRVASGEHSHLVKQHG